MAALNHPASDAVSTAATASTDGVEAASPLKLQLEVTLPSGLGGELAAWRKTFERFATVMERWLESALAHPGASPPPVMPWPTPPVPALQPPVPSTPPVSLKEARPTPVVSLPRAPVDMPPLLVESPPTEVAPALVSPAYQRDDSRRPAEIPDLQEAEQTTATAVVDRSAALREAAALAQRGERHRAVGQKEDALRCYRESLALDDECTQAYLGRASVYLEQGRLNDALVDCNAALKHEPERAVLYVLRGLVHTRLGNPKRAIDEANEALRLDPNLPSAFMLRGTSRFKTGMMADALADVKEAIRRRPNDARFYGELARLLAQTGQHEQAARAYGKVLQLAPRSHSARLHRGMELRQAGDPAAADEELTEYLRHFPDNAVAHYQRGLCRLAQRNYPLASTDFDKAIALNPDDMAAYAAKERTLQQWEGAARPSRSGGTAATVAHAATAANTPSAPTKSHATPSRSTPSYTPPPKPIPPKPAPKKPVVRRRYRRDDEPAFWVRPAKWVSIAALVGLLGFGGFQVFAAIVKARSYSPDSIPQTSAKLSADDLVKRLSGNAADAELSDQFVEVTGTVSRYFEDKTPPVVVLSVARSNASVTCTLRSNVSFHQQSQLSRIEGDCQVTVVGKCAHPEGGSVPMNECLIVKVFKGRPRTVR